MEGLLEGEVLLELKFDTPVGLFLFDLLELPLLGRNGRSLVIVNVKDPLVMILVRWITDTLEEARMGVAVPVTLPEPNGPIEAAPVPPCGTACPVTLPDPNGPTEVRLTPPGGNPFPVTLLDPNGPAEDELPKGAEAGEEALAPVLRGPIPVPLLVNVEEEPSLVAVPPVTIGAVGNREGGEKRPDDPDAPVGPTRLFEPED